MAFISNRFLANEVDTYPMTSHLQVPKTSVTGDGTAYYTVMSTELFDGDNIFTPATGIITIPESGFWELIGGILIRDYLVAHAAAYGWFEINTSPTPTKYAFNLGYPGLMSTAIDGCLLNGCVLVALTAGQQVKMGVVVTCSTKDVGIKQDVSTVYRTSISAYKIRE